MEPEMSMQNTMLMSSWCTATAGAGSTTKSTESVLGSSCGTRSHAVCANKQVVLWQLLHVIT